jgi:diaminopimelate decarboxylase
MTEKVPKLGLFPETAEIRSNHLFIGGCDTVELAREFGTPLYVFDEATLRHRAAEFTGEFQSRYPNTLVIYACKAFINRALALLLKEEGLGLDVVSGGELAIARSVDFPQEKVYFHGNNKSAEELGEALDWGIGRIVVDNFHELSLLSGLAQERGTVQDILLRLSPGIDPHTHHLTTTGVVDSKFGFLLAQTEEAVAEALASPHLNLIGLHLHLGSPIFEVEPYQQAIAIVLELAAEMKAKHGLELKEFSPGGGFAISYTLDSPAPPVSRYAEAIVSALCAHTQRLGLEPPRLIVEPGRSLVGRAGVALYRTGAMKNIPGIRKYVSLDGGMGDNIRPPLYGARYEALVANRAEEAESETVTLAGRFCESGDILVKDVALPPLSAGDIIAIPASGAYCIPMSSNYNASLRPAIVMVQEGRAHLIRRRESYEHLMARDLV